MWQAVCNCNSSRCSADFLKKVKDGSFLRKWLLLSACFSREKRLRKRFLTFKLLLNCGLPLELSRLRHNSCLLGLKAGAGSLIFLKNCPSFTFFKKSMQPARKNERERDERAIPGQRGNSMNERFPGSAAGSGPGRVLRPLSGAHACMKQQIRDDIRLFFSCRLTYCGLLARNRILLAALRGETFAAFSCKVIQIILFARKMLLLIV
ncbi:MAG: hypothetical protein IJM24_11185 [Clostridia bacterium]|nr:hypothetical protein [Clostridia bacterium]